MLPSTLQSAYFGNAELPRFLTGSLALALALLGVILLPHLLIQTTLLLRDWRSSPQVGFTDFLRERQTRLHLEYYALLCSSSEEGVVCEVEPTREPLIHSLWSGLGYAYFSFESWTVTASLYTHLWNTWFAFRSFFPLFHPLIGLSHLCFPNFFRTAISLKGRRVVPTSMNGGTRNRLSQTYLFLFYPELLSKLRTIDAAILNVLRSYPQDQQTQVEAHVKSLCSDTYLLSPRRWYLSAEDSLKLQLTSKLQLLSQLPSTLPPSSSGLMTQWSEWVTRSLNPTRSRSVEILQHTHHQMKDSRAMARAVRYMVASNLIDKPMELAFYFICYASISEGLLRPIQPIAFNDHSWFFLSRFVFLNLFLYSVVASICSDAWMKIQQDSQNILKFEEIPKGEDAKLPFWRWQLRKTFFNSENSWWGNQHYTVTQFIIPTLKATFIAACFTQWLTLGRVDLDYFVMNLILTLALPTTGLSWKLDQGFELASAWVYRNVAEKSLLDPVVLRRAQVEITKKRFVFNFAFRIWDNLTLNFIALLATTSHSQLGDRALSRLLLGGRTISEWLELAYTYFASGSAKQSLALLTRFISQ
jgi:hypothetical protein